MPAALVIVSRIHDRADPAFKLKTDDVGFREAAARRPRQLGRRQRGRYESTTGMRERDETHVVVVQRMRGHTVGQRSQFRARPLTRPENATRAASILRGHRLHDAAGAFHRPRQNHPNRVPDRSRGPFARRSRWYGTGHKFRYPGRARFDVDAHEFVLLSIRDNSTLSDTLADGP